MTLQFIHAHLGETFREIPASIWALWFFATLAVGVFFLFLERGTR